MNKLLSKLIVPLIWTYYSALMYTAYNPGHDYINYLENANVLYLIVHIPLNLFFGLLVLFITFKKKELLQEVRDKLKNEEEDKKQKVLKDMVKLKSKKTRTIFALGTLFVLGAMFSSFIVLGYYFLGTIMLLGFIISKMFTKFVYELAEEFDNE